MLHVSQPNLPTFLQSFLYLFLFSLFMTPYPFLITPVHPSMWLSSHTCILCFFFGHVSSLHPSCLSRYVTLTNWCSFVKAFYFPCHFHLDREAKCEHMWQTPTLMRMSVCLCVCVCVCVCACGSVNNGSRITADDTVTPPIFHRWQSDVGWMTF